MGTHTTTAGRVKVSVALAPDCYAQLKQMAAGPRGLGALLDNLIRAEAAGRGQAAAGHAGETAAAGGAGQDAGGQGVAAAVEQRWPDVARRLERQSERLRLVNEIERAILAAQSPAAIAEAAAEGLKRAIGAACIDVCLWQVQGEVLEVLAVAGLAFEQVGPGAIIKLPFWRGLAAVRQGQVAFREDLASPPDPAPDVQAALAKGAHSSVVIPLMLDGQPSGHLAILRYETGRLPDEDLALAKQVADALAVAIHHARLFEAERRARQTLETVQAAGAALTQSLDLDTVMESLLDHLRGLIPYDSANVLLRTGDTLTVRGSRGYEKWTDPALVRDITFDVQANLLLRRLLSGTTSVLIPDTSRNPDWERVPGAEHVRSWLAVPLVAGGRAVGLFSLDKAEAGYFTEEHARLAEALAPQAAAAVQNARLYAEIKARREQLQSLSRRLVELQEQERRALSRDLHDTSGQSITALKLGLSALKRGDDDPETTRARVAELLRLADMVSEDLHRLAVNLRPATLDRYGLVPALEQLLTEFRTRTGLEVSFDAHDRAGSPARLPGDVEATLYRIVQEALTNIVRHAQARVVSVIIQNAGDWVRVIVEDDGRGFDLAEGWGSGRLGLVGMRERAEMLGGSLEIESSPGRGTTIYASAPASRPAAAEDAAEGVGDFGFAAPPAGETGGEPDARLAEAAELARAKALGDALLDIVAAMARCGSADEILRLVLARSAEVIGRDNAFITRHAAGGWEVAFVYPERPDPRRMADGAGAAFAWVEQTRQVLVVSDTEALPPGDALRLEDYRAHSYACIPLLAGERLLGVLSFVNYAAAAAFHPSEIEFLGRLATFAALALLNAQLNEVETRQREELARRVEELQAVLDLLPVGIGIAYDPACKQIKANPALARMLDIRPDANPSLSLDEDQGRPAYRVYREGRELSAEELPMQMAAALGRDVRDLVTEVVHADGTRLSLLGSAVPLFDQRGLLRGAVAGFVDITERQAMTEALAQREAGLREALLQKDTALGALALEKERYRTLFDGMGEGFAVHEMICDAAGKPVDYRFLDINPAFEKLTGLAGQSTVGRTAREVLPGLEEYWVTTYGAVALTGQPIRFENYSRPLGRWYEVMAFSPARGQFATIFSDITHFREREEALRRTGDRLARSEATYRAIAQSYPNGAIYVFDRDLRFLVVEGELLRALGQASAGLEGKTIWEAVDAATVQTIEPRYRRTLAGESLHFETLYGVPYGDRMLAADYRPIRDVAGEIVAGLLVVQDLSERIRIERDLAAANAALQAQADELRTAADRLEQRVQERTADLVAANHALLQAQAAAGQREAALQQQSQRLEILHEIDRSILAARAPAEIAGAAIGEVQRVTQAQRVTVFACDFATQTAEILAEAGVSAATYHAGQRVPLSEYGMLGALKPGEVITIPDVAEMPGSTAWKEIAARAGIRSAALVALAAGEEVIGALAISRAEPGLLTTGALDFTRHVTDSLAVAVHNAQLGQQVQRSREQLQALSRRLVEVQERERRFVADQLYNQAGQVLAAVKLHLAMLKQGLLREPDAARRLQETQRILDGAMRDLHDLAADLRPASLDQLGLVAALSQYVADFGRRHDMRATLASEEVEGLRIPPEVETALYRIAQEALANVAEHSQATTVEVTLSRGERGLTLMVADDGRGFDPDSVRARASLGLVAMRERAESAGGSLTIESQPGGGTTVVVETRF